MQCHARQRNADIGYARVPSVFVIDVLKPHACCTARGPGPCTARHRAGRSRNMHDQATMHITVLVYVLCRCLRMTPWHWPPASAAWSHPHSLTSAPHWEASAATCSTWAQTGWEDSCNRCARGGGGLLPRPDGTQYAGPLNCTFDKHPCFWPVGLLYMCLRLSYFVLLQ